MSFAKLKPLRDHLSFISVHCKSADRVSLPLIIVHENAKRHSDVYIIGCSLLAFAILASFGNIPAIDAFFFAVSSCTESGLNTIDVKDLKLGQQLVIYIFPIITNLAFVNIGVVLVRLRYFEKRLRKIDPRLLKQRRPAEPIEGDTGNDVELRDDLLHGVTKTTVSITNPSEQSKLPEVTTSHPKQSDHIAWANDVGKGNALRIPSPRELDQGENLNPSNRSRLEADGSLAGARFTVMPTDGDGFSFHGSTKSHSARGPGGQPPGVDIAANTSSSQRARDAIQSVMSPREVLESAFVYGSQPRSRRMSTQSTCRSETALQSLPGLSNQVTIGRNSNFSGLTPQDREELGGVEYRSLKLLLKVIVALYAGLHIFGVIGLVPWILHCASKYREVLASSGQNNVWWAIYSVQTMISNLGFTLTPDSMVSFRDASWPMVLLTFLAFAGNTCYPIILRFILWAMQKTVPRRSSLREPLQFLLDHPRRCYTLLFPRNVTWILFSILFVMNFIDALLIVVLDLDNPEVNTLPLASRILAATFQAASARHTGTASFNLAKVNPAVQFSLLTMMYIAVFPIAMSVRHSNTYEETTLGKYAADAHPEESQRASSYIVQHMRNQLSFDLWYIFLGTFCICIAQADEIADPQNAAFSVFAIMFECVSAYGNVGLSLGTNETLTSLSGDFTVFSKLVICAVMLRGRHRGLPYALDHAVMLPSDRLDGMDGDWEVDPKAVASLARAKTL
jgi:Trk-type K+ transport system membrane component